VTNQIKNLMAPSPIQPGDAGLVIKADGNVEVFNTFGIENPEDVTDVHIETMKKLTALIYVLHQKPILDTVIEAIEQAELASGTSALQRIQAAKLH
jgi:hypothetical protein